MKVINFGIEPINSKLNLLDDNIGFVKQYDFSTANTDDLHRIHAVTSVATVCYNTEHKSINSSSLYDRLGLEAGGLPSSSFEFIPVLISESEFEAETRKSTVISLIDLKIAKHSIPVKSKEGLRYRLTNYRAVTHDYELTNGEVDFRKHYNYKDYEIKIIKDNFYVFLAKIDLSTRAQLVRHRMLSFQERSRRYVSGKKLPFDFYLEDKVKATSLKFYPIEDLDGETFSNHIVVNGFNLNANKLANMSVELYNKALEDGVKPQAARRLILQAMYTDIWIGFNSETLADFFKQRTKADAQPEIRSLALGIQELVA